VAHPLKLPKDLYLGEVAGVAVNSKGHIFVFSRGNITGPAYAAAAAQLLEFALLMNTYRKFLSKNAIDSFARRSRNAARSKPCGSLATLPSGEGRSTVGVFMNA
jgi:hypothetical protein